MSHNIETRTYKDPVDRKDISERLGRYVDQADYLETGGFGGSPLDIRWYDNVAPLIDSDAADEFIRDHDKHDYDNLAVRFYRPSKPVSSAKLTALTDRRYRTSQKMEELKEKKHFKGVKSSLITCKGCGSKIARDYLKNHCPVCDADMRPQSVLDHIQKLKDDCKELDRQIKEERHRLIKKTKNKEVYWVVKFEYHT